MLCYMLKANYMCMVITLANYVQVHASQDQSKLTLGPKDGIAGKSLVLTLQLRQYDQI